MVIKMVASELKINQQAMISKLNLKMSDQRRCFNMGIYEGMSITLIKKAPFKDPYLFAINGNEICMRKSDADCIEVVVL